ncbi:HigA family addiction module antitoxin [Dyadobacter chenhuakuii]|uniref:HigA family addiction module antitoxin n=1 Tax=Dyadobacter chenhuakuii TaxID=2909339 RepID=A0ABY4XMG5_9BACT|nr:HigA family addiction module antitoxin [Dyadobacter chenhuakuii]MCF2495100.1 HigA family addiction module antitoxin [Dyadobacter chenhuakuii]USJ31588.1 HigA family addiction module antitoxin [Dyadobacter chenhuakuii]
MVLFDPAHPGELIRETLDGIYEETGKRLTVEHVAEILGTTRKTLSAIINGKSAVSPEMAIRLGAAFPNTTAEFWLGVQKDYNLAQARKRVDASNIRAIWEPKAMQPA